MIPDSDGSGDPVVTALTAPNGGVKNIRGCDA